jgi:hypothetical protein
MFRGVLTRFEPQDFKSVTFYQNSGSEVAMRFSFSKDQSEFNAKRTADMFLKSV